MVADFEGIKTEYNDYGSHWMDMEPSVTDASGKASIELFPGNFKFKANKNYSAQTEMLELTSSGTTGTVEFQTATAVGFVRDCDLNQGVAGIDVEYNDYGSHWIDLSPSLTGADGKASIELFPGTFNLKAKIIYTSESKPITLTASGTTTQVEFNPTRVCFNYPGVVKYNDYGSHWLTMTCGKYMFPGTYKFRFFTGNTLDFESNIEINGCKLEKALIFVQLKNSLGSGLPDGTFDYRIGWGSYSNIGTDNIGNGIWSLIDGSPSNTKVKVAFKGATLEKEQNIKTNPKFIFATKKITAQLLASDNTTDLTSGATFQYRFGWGAYSSLDPVAGEELLPVNTKVQVTYKGASVEKEQNINSDATFDFATKKITAQLLASDNTADLTAGATFQYRFGWGAYSSLDPVAGEELLPVNTKVNVTYKGASVEKEQNINSDATFDFATKKITAQLLASDNTTDLTAGATFQYRFGWGAYSSLDPVAGEELLPVNTKVNVTYKGASVEKEQNINSDATFDFATKKVTASLTEGANDLTASATWDYRYGWGAYSTLIPTGEELLPVNTKVRVTYNSTTKEKEQNVNTDPAFSFTWDGTGLKSGILEEIADEVIPEFSFKLYPVPANTRLIVEITFDTNAGAVYQVIDMTGRTVKNGTWKLNRGFNTNEIAVDDLVDGQYIFRLKSTEKVITEKFSVSKY
jgi:YHS domain-containing protein